MVNRRTFPGHISIRRQTSPFDVVIALVVVGAFYGIARIGESLSVNVTPGSIPSQVPTGISHVPYYRQHRADGRRRPVVHPVQRHRREAGWIRPLLGGTP
jgi:hypothetical protein